MKKTPLHNCSSAPGSQRPPVQYHPVLWLLQGNADDFCGPPFTAIIHINWPILRRFSATKELSEKRIIFGYRKEKNLKDMLVHAKLPLVQTVNKSDTSKNLCKTTKCNHCPLLNKDGEIYSNWGKI